MQTQEIRLDPTPPRHVQLRARDGFTLHADLYEPTAPRWAVVIAPAMAVHRSYYAAFASYLAEHGAVALVPDYRGVGDSRPPSLRGMHARLRDWAELDLEGALDYLAERHPGLPLRCLGHSIGGQLIGLLDAGRLDRAVLVASQSGYHGHWPWPQRARMLALWYVVVPGLSHALGYLPIGRITGSGEDVPKGVGLDWTRWGRSERYLFSEADLPANNSYAHFTGKLRSYAILDDELAPPASVAWLCDRFTHAQRELRRVSPADLGVSKIGHFAPFRPKFQATLWEQWRAFLA
ncbi:MAG TPA: alpha/beta fold hydrolase [Polyangiales bacterium]|nr:alpha/beta fold hydrolase [Polyangiales bacterium]